MKGHHRDHQNDLGNLCNIKCVILDVDGVMTDGRIILTNHQDELKHFNVKDGLGIRLLQGVGVEFAVITGKTSQLLIDRLHHLHMNPDYIFQGQSNKIEAYESLKMKLSLADAHMAYMGDDLPDLPLLKRVGFSAAPADAHRLILAEKLDFIAKHKAGKGAVRDLCDHILGAYVSDERLVLEYAQFGAMQGDPRNKISR